MSLQVFFACTVPFSFFSFSNLNNRYFYLEPFHFVKTEKMYKMKYSLDAIFWISIITYYFVGIAIEIILMFIIYYIIARGFLAGNFNTGKGGGGFSGGGFGSGSFGGGSFGGGSFGGGGAGR